MRLSVVIMLLIAVIYIKLVSATKLLQYSYVLRVHLLSKDLSIS